MSLQVNPQTLKLRIGFSPCPNDTFMFDALVHQKIDTEGLDFEVVMEDVETLNQKALKGELDISKISFAAFIRAADQYQLLNCGSALGKGVGPLVVRSQKSGVGSQQPAAGSQQSGVGSQQPAVGSQQSVVGSQQPAAMQETVHGDWKIAIPGKNTTANFLFSLFFPEAKNKTEMVFSEIEHAVLSGAVDAGVIIHENRFTYEQKGLKKICDLGELWEKETGHPIPLGGIAVKKNLAEDVKQKIDRVLKRSVEFAFANPESSTAYVKEHAQEMDEEIRRKHIETYVNEFSIDLGEEGRKAIHVLYQKAKETGIVQVVPAGIFVKQESITV